MDELMSYELLESQLRDYDKGEAWEKRIKRKKSSDDILKTYKTKAGPQGKFPWLINQSSQRPKSSFISRQNPKSCFGKITDKKGYIGRNGQMQRSKSF